MHVRVLVHKWMRKLLGCWLDGQARFVAGPSPGAVHVLPGSRRSTEVRHVADVVLTLGHRCKCH